MKVFLNQDQIKFTQTYGIKVAAKVFDMNERSVRHVIDRQNIQMPSAAEINANILEIVVAALK